MGGSDLLPGWKAQRFETITCGMNPHNISTIRFRNQQIAGSGFIAVKEIASWMGALQAQDFKMSKWAFGIRLKDSTETTINKAIDSGEIIRTHLLRPTWHFVSSKDIYWISELTAAQIRASVKFRDIELGLTEAIFRKSNSVIEKSLRNGIHLTREELISNLVKANIDVADNRASHLLLRAETNGIMCGGRLKNSKPTYTLLSEWVTKTKTLYRDEALKELSQRYFTSHGPATLQDFTWWSGLSSNDSKLALEFIKSDLLSEIIEKQTYWFVNSGNYPVNDPHKVFLLPAYDEFLISYRDRTASLPFLNQKNAVSVNGIFYPTIVRNGQVIGTWKHINKKESVVLEMNLFDKTDPETEIDFSEASAQYANFIGKETEAIIPNFPNIRP
jgi:hypothetical protein